MKTSVLSRRHLFPLVGGAAAIAAVAPGSATADSLASLRKPPALKARFVYVGTYTFPGTAPGGTHPSQALGIYVFRMSPSDGGLTPLQVEQIPNPSYLALDPSLQHLYSVNEMTDGGVSAFSINQANGTLSFVNMQLRISACSRRGSTYSPPAIPAAIFRFFGSTATVLSAA